MESMEDDVGFQFPRDMMMRRLDYIQVLGRYIKLTNLVMFVWRKEKIAFLKSRIASHTTCRVIVYRLLSSGLDVECLLKD